MIGINIKNVEVRDKIAIDSRTKIQKIICQLFNIKAELSYHYRITFYSQDKSIMAGDTVISEDEVKWRVLSIDANGEHLLSTINPVVFSDIYKDVFIISRSFSESKMN